MYVDFSTGSLVRLARLDPGTVLALVPNYYYYDGQEEVTTKSANNNRKIYPKKENIVQYFPIISAR